MSYTKRERVEAVLHGEVPDRPPVTAYRHFPGKEQKPEDIAEVMLSFYAAYDWDWIKINTSADYYYEVWGNKYDYTRYEGNVPARVSWIVHAPEDLEKITEQAGDAGVLKNYLEAVLRIRAGAGDDVPVFNSIFAPIAILLNLIGGRSPGRYRPAPREECPLLPLFREYREETHRALKAIANTMASYAEESLRAGADGIFFAEMGLAREGYLTFEEWKEFVVPYDRIVLEALGSKPSMLHTCGISGNPERFAAYPIRGLHWAESAPGNPPIRGSESWLGNIAAMGGVNENYFGQGKAEQVGRDARRSVAENRHRPFMLVPECTVAMNSAPEELMALREAAEC